MKLFNYLRSFLQEEQAVTTNEYAIMLALIVLAAVGSISGVGTKVGDVFSTLDAGLPTGS